MVSDLQPSDSGTSNYAIQDLSRAAIQAIYHHATGKTENMSQDYSGNVVVNSTDIDRLHQIILDQLQVHTVEYGPTVTIVVKQANDRAITHSSWEHYKAVFTSSNHISSEITLKYEFVLKIQNTPGPQRCVITINIDSSLPILAERDNEESYTWSYWLFIAREWQTVKVSIDFVDFMVARGFGNVVEEWFKSLRRTNYSGKNSSILRRFGLYDNLAGQFGRVGFASFILSYMWFHSSSLSIRDIIYSGCFGLLLWSLYLAVRPFFVNLIRKRVTASIIPSVLLLSEGDTVAYANICEKINSSKATYLAMLGVVLVNIGLNVLASYIYGWLTKGT